MKCGRGDLRKGLTRVEALVVIAVITVLVVFLLPMPSRQKARAARSQCINNLRQNGLGFREWPVAQDPDFPMSVSTNYGGTLEFFSTGEVFRHFQVLSNRLSTPVTLVCPSDVRQPAKNFDTLRNSNISYFIALEAAEQTPSLILSGDRNLTNGTLLPNGILEITSNSVVGWTDKMHNGQGNVGLADGSVQAVSSSYIQKMLAKYLHGHKPPRNADRINCSSGL